MSERVSQERVGIKGEAKRISLPAPISPGTDQQIPGVATKLSNYNSSQVLIDRLMYLNWI